MTKARGLGRQSGSSPGDHSSCAARLCPPNLEQTGPSVSENMFVHLSCMPLYQGGMGSKSHRTFFFGLFGISGPQWAAGGARRNLPQSFRRLPRLNLGALRPLTSVPYVNRRGCSTVDDARSMPDSMPRSVPSDMHAPV